MGSHDQGAWQLVCLLLHLPLKRGGRRTRLLAGRGGWGSMRGAKNDPHPARTSAPTSPFQGEVEQEAWPRPERQAEFSYALPSGERWSKWRDLRVLLAS